MNTLKSINPYTGEVFFETAIDSPVEVYKKLDRSFQSFQSWKQQPIAKRTEYLRVIARKLKENKHQYAATITQEMGKLIGEAEGEVEKCALVCEYYADKAETFLQHKSLDVPDGNGYVRYDPLGPVLALMPWNFPFWQVFRFLAPNIAAGNTAVLKHADNVTQCGLAIEELLQDAGLPEGAFEFLKIDVPRIADIIDDKRIKAVTLTGSEKAGREVASQAGKNLKKLVLELGGSDAFVVLKSADLKAAAKIAVKSRMINAGQSCIAAKRFIVEDAVFDEFLGLFQDKLAFYLEGDPMNRKTTLAPMASRRHAEQLKLQLDRSLAMGALISPDEGQLISGHAFFKPVLITGLQRGMPAYEEELFGPAASFFRVKDEKEAIWQANDSVYGLGGSVWTNDPEKGAYLASQINSGAVYINKMMASHPAVPFGGVGNSGYGRELSQEGILEFVNKKSVWQGV